MRLKYSGLSYPTICAISDMKTGLVVEGGGMKCAYSAGILDRFLDEHITFDEWGD